MRIAVTQVLAQRCERLFVRLWGGLRLLQFLLPVFLAIQHHLEGTTGIPALRLIGRKTAVRLAAQVAGTGMAQQSHEQPVRVAVRAVERIKWEPLPLPDLNSRLLDELLRIVRRNG